MSYPAIENQPWPMHHVNVMVGFRKFIIVSAVLMFIVIPFAFECVCPIMKERYSYDRANAAKILGILETSLLRSVSAAMPMVASFSSVEKCTQSVHGSLAKRQVSFTNPLFCRLFIVVVKKTANSSL